MIYKYIILFLFFIILIYLFFCLSKKENFNNNKDGYNFTEPKSFFNISKYKDLLINNHGKNIYNISLSEDIKIDEENCFEKCDTRNCTNLSERINSLKKCLQCNSQENKCYTKSIINGNCDDCTGVKMEDKLDCFNLDVYGCPNPKNINSNEGVKPYFIEIDSNSVNSPYNKKCLFCWNLTNYI
jgi:hypothetical protein